MCTYTIKRKVKRGKITFEKKHVLYFQIKNIKVLKNNILQKYKRLILKIKDKRRTGIIIRYFFHIFFSFYSQCFTHSCISFLILAILNFLTLAKVLLKIAI